MKYKVEKPYPSPRVENKNLNYAKLLLENYAGSISEDTAIHLYFYQHIILEKEYPEISHILEEISIVEMHHLELLGETINLLGETPFFGTYTNCNVIYWDGNNVNYNMDIKNILKINMDAERETIKNYKRNIEFIDDIYIKQLLRRIIEDEELHLSIFESLYRKLI